MIKGLNILIVSFQVILILALWLPVSYGLITSSGGPWGYGLIVLPIPVITILFGFFGIRILMKRKKKPTVVLLINCLGLLWSLFWLITFWLYATPLERTN